MSSCFAAVVEIVLVVQRRWWALLIAPIGLGLELVTFLTVNTVVGPTPPGRVPSSDPSRARRASRPVTPPRRVVLWGADRAAVLLGLGRTGGSRVACCVVVVRRASPSARARVYRGMHHPTDVLFGALMGLAALTITVLAVRVRVDDVRARGATATTSRR